MASALMAWVWIGLILAQLNNAESHRYAHGHVAGQDELYAGYKQLIDADPEDRTDRSFPAPVWSFLQGENLLLTCFLCLTVGKHRDIQTAVIR